MVTRLKQYLLVAVATLSLVLMPVAANAQYAQLSCKNGSVVPQTELYDNSSQGFCSYTGITHIFSQVVCDFVTIINNVLGQVYCGIQYSLTPILAILLTLYIAIFGVQILMGTAQLTAKEMVIRLLKIAGVWVFATQSTWGLSIMFQFLLAAAGQASMWVINYIHPSIDCANADAINGANIMTLYQYLDCLVYAAIAGPFTTANDKVIGFFIILMFFFPSIFTLIVIWTLNTLMMLARTIVYFLLCLSAIAFLIALSPIFLSFMLFQSTAYFFEDWLKHLISYTLQIVIVFAIISLWIATMSYFGGFFDELSNLIWPYEHVLETNVFSPDNTYGICKVAMTDANPPALPWAPPGAMCNGEPCPTGVDSCIDGQPCLPSMQCDPDYDPGSSDPKIAKEAMNDLIPPSQLENHPEFINFMVYNLTALIIIAYTFGVLIKEAPKIATQLSGPATVPPLVNDLGVKGFGQLGGAGVGGSAKGVLAPPTGTGDAVKSFLRNASQMLTGRSKPPSG